MHIEEKKIELFALEPGRFSAKETAEIQAHLEECNYCKEVFYIYNKMYDELKEASEKNPSENDEEIANRIKAKLNRRKGPKLLNEKSNLVSIYDGKAEIIERPKLNSIQTIFYLIKNYPIKTGSFTLAAAFAVVLIFSIMKKPITNDNPVVLGFKNSTLQAFNNEGNMIWSKTLSRQISNRSIDTLMQWIPTEKRCVNLLDIDDDGKNEVLISGFHWDTGFYKPDSLYCFNHDGSLRWKTSPESQKYNYTPEWNRTHWMILEFYTAKTKYGNKLIVIAVDHNYGGAVVSMLDPNTGTVTSSLYHSGWFYSQNHFDIDNDGNEEIFLGGTSSYDKPCIVVINPEYLMGIMPYQDSKKHYIKGNAIYYILLPVSKLGLLLSTEVSFHSFRIEKFNETGITVLTRDVVWQNEQEIILQWSFDSTFACRSISLGTGYLKYFDDNFKQGKIKTPFDSNYRKSLIDSIKYWDGDKFVNYPTKNKYWNEKFLLPKMN